MKITLKDIADETGYSVSTVSRVLKGSSKISEQTKQKVLTSAKELGYVITKPGNSYHSNNTLNIALLATGFHEGEFYVCFFNGLNKAAAKNNIRLSLMGVLEPEKELVSLVKVIGSGHYDGMILFIPEFRHHQYRQISKNIPDNFPVISNTLIEDPVFPTITFDSYSGGHLAAKYFEEKGYLSVGIIEGPVERSEARFRSNGFKDYVRQNPNLNLLWKFSGNFTFEAGAEAFHSFEKLDKKPRAIFACNDSMASGFMEAAKQKRYSFPEDIAITGYDDLPFCRHYHPTISSIHTNYEQLGMATMKVIRERLLDTDLKTNMISFVPVSLHSRESS